MGLGPPRLAYLDGIIMHFFFKIRTFATTLPKPNIDAEHRPGPKKKVVSQPSIFKCHVKFRTGTWISYNPFHTLNFADSKHLFFQHSSYITQGRPFSACFFYLNTRTFVYTSHWVHTFLSSDQPTLAPCSCDPGIVVVINILGSFLNAANDLQNSINQSLDSNIRSNRS